MARCPTKARRVRASTVRCSPNCGHEHPSDPGPKQSQQNRVAAAADHVVAAGAPFDEDAAARALARVAAFAPAHELRRGQLLAQRARVPRGFAVLAHRMATRGALSRARADPAAPMPKGSAKAEGAQHGGGDAKPGRQPDRFAQRRVQQRQRGERRTAREACHSRACRHLRILDARQACDVSLARF